MVFDTTHIPILTSTRSRPALVLPIWRSSNKCAYFSISAYSLLEVGPLTQTYMEEIFHERLGIEGWAIEFQSRKFKSLHFSLDIAFINV